LIHLSDLDPKDDDHLCTVIVALMQKYRRELKHAGIEKVSIGFRIYDADGTSGRLDKKFFSSHKPCAQTASFTHMREAGYHGIDLFDLLCLIYSFDHREIFEHTRIF
uniref:Family C2 unassigned peptidase (inferred by orthology to a S. mansoni protein) n=1 Tax=Anisakis simplex TaxID=6269 RepID=A0A0M3J7P4_ANISI